MTGIEIGLAVLANLRELLVFAAVVFGLFFVGVIIASFVFSAIKGTHLRDTPEQRSSYDEREIREADHWLDVLPAWRRRAGVSFLCFAVLAAVPTVDDLWRVRIGLLKLEVASPANMQSAQEHIEVIVKGLECKYLNENCPVKEAK
jgi:hypothetical protein